MELLVVYKNTVTDDIRNALMRIVKILNYRYSLSTIQFVKIGMDFTPHENIKTIVSIGGDGTFAYSARIAHSLDIPIIGLFDGTLGFLTEMSPIEFYEEDIKNINFKTVEYSILQSKTGNAINDIVIKNSNPSKMLEYELYLDTQKVGKFKGDGIIVSTSIGSTAYNLSMNGPIVLNPTGNIIINNFGTHTLFNRPLITSDSSIVTVVVNDDAVVMYDGNKSDMVLKTDEYFSITSSSQNLKVIKISKGSIFKTMRTKLHWNT